MKGSKKLGLIIGILLFVILLMGATYAFWLWRGNIASISVTAQIPFNCAADGGVHESTVALAPSACTHDRFAIQREITVDHQLFSPKLAVYMDMILTVNDIGAGLAESSNFKYAITTEPNSCTTGVLSEGTFTNKTSGSKIDLFVDRVFSYTGILEQNKYYLYIWIDAVEENRDVLNQNFDFSLSLECTQGTLPGYLMLINKANDASVTTYSEGNTAEMYTFSQPETEQVAATTDYRYIGNSPNNYITFNDEMWRIIGVFDGQIKIVKDDRVSSSMPWDYKKSEVGSSLTDRGSNDWVDSQLMYMLNPSDIEENVALKTGYTFDGTYVYDAEGAIIYQKGCKPAATDGTSYNCTTIDWKLNETALTQVDNAIYYLGSMLSSISGKTASDFYIYERSDNKYNDVRSINWTGKVGLIYPSDYVYSFAYGVDDECYNSADVCDESNPSSSWMYTTSYYPWTITPRIWSSEYVYLVRNGGYVGSYSAEFGFGVRPVVYLKSNIGLSGTGTRDDPYVISLLEDDSNSSGNTGATN